MQMWVHAENKPNAFSCFQTVIGSTDAEQSAQAGWAEDQDSIGESHSAWRTGTRCVSLAQFEPALCPAVDTVNREQTGEGHLRCQH